MSTPAKFMTQSDVAKLFGVTTVTVWRWAHKKPWLAFPKPVAKNRTNPNSKSTIAAGRLFYDRAEVEAYHERMLAEFIEHGRPRKKRAA